MKIPRKFTSKRRYNKEIISIARLSGSICYIDKQLRDKHKKWTDVYNELCKIHGMLNAKINIYQSLKPTIFTERLKAFAKAEITNCETVKNKHMVP